MLSYLVYLLNQLTMARIVDPVHPCHTRRMLSF